MIIEVTVNGKVRHLQARSGDRLVDLLRNELALDSLLPDCLVGRCGRCLVYMDGRLVQSCLIPAFKARGAVILSYEALAPLAETKDIETAFDEMDYPPCPFCRAAKVLVVHHLLAVNPSPERETAAEAISLVDCPCTDHEALLHAVDRAAEIRAERIYHRAGQ